MQPSSKKLFQTNAHPKVMGILNVTPDSFAQVGRTQNIDEALNHVAKMIDAGVDIVDIGAEPTNPTVHPVVSLQEEMDRLLPILEALRQEFDVPLSIDTSKPEIMRLAIQSGVSLINDVRALRVPGALDVIAKSDVAVCLMHMAYPDGNVPAVSPYANKDIVPIVKNFLAERLAVCAEHNIARERIILDPGIGSVNFGKNCRENLTLLARLDEIKALGLPVLVGVSRKAFIGEILNRPAEGRLYGTIAANLMAALHGADIIRVHDVLENIEALKVMRAILHTRQLKNLQDTN